MATREGENGFCFSSRVLLNAASKLQYFLVVARWPVSRWPVPAFAVDAAEMSTPLRNIRTNFNFECTLNRIECCAIPTAIPNGQEVHSEAARACRSVTPNALLKTTDTSYRVMYSTRDGIGGINQNVTRSTCVPNVGTCLVAVIIRKRIVSFPSVFRLTLVNDHK